MDANEADPDASPPNDGERSPEDLSDLGVTSRARKKRGAVGKVPAGKGERVVTVHDLKAGRPGSHSAEEAVAVVRRVLKEAAAYPYFETKDQAGDLAILIRRAAKALDHVSDGTRTRRLYRPKVSAPNALLSSVPLFPEGSSRLATADGLSLIEDARAHHAKMPYAEIPTWWFQRIQQARGKGDTRSERAYFEAIHILSYVMFMYSGTERFSGDVLWMNSASVCKLYCMTKGDYTKAIRYLAAKGYIHRIVIRGFVPWAPRAKGVYTFAVPRLAMVRASNNPRHYKDYYREPENPRLQEEGPSVEPE